MALDEESHIVHIYDINHVVEPTYHFGRKEYELSEGFFKLAEVLNQKYFFVEKRNQDLEKWIESLTWIFYSSNQTIKCFQRQNFSLIPLKDLVSQSEQSLIDAKLFPKYVTRMLTQL